jgi:hypothetical protein
LITPSKESIANRRPPLEEEEMIDDGHGSWSKECHGHGHAWSIMMLLLLVIFGSSCVELENVTEGLSRWR